MLRKVVLAAASLLILGACEASDIAGRAEKDGGNSQELEASLRQNEANSATFKALQQEIEPHLRFDTDGRWSIQQGALLSEGAKEFAELALRSSSGRADNLPNAAIMADRAGASVTDSRNGVRCYWWGCRFTVSHATIQALSLTCLELSCRRAISAFLAAIGTTGWAATVVPWALPAYVLLLKWADRQCGNRGAYLDMTFALVTVVRPICM